MIFRPHIFSNFTSLILQLSELRLFPRTTFLFLDTINKSRRNWRRFRRYF